MKSETWTVQQLFQDRRQYRVPFYQRPYVWNLEEQWEPIWGDIAEKAANRLEGVEPAPHFLGAIVLEPQPSDGLRGVPTLHIIDGQQRLTTLQYILAALSIELVEHEAQSILPLIEGCVWNNNPDTMNRPEIEKYKLYPTFRDRPPFEAAMTAQTKDELRSRFSPHFTQAGALRRIGMDHPPALEAIWFFSAEIDKWISKQTDKKLALEKLAEAILRDLKLVLISLEPQDDAQVIFETLNGRGAELHATDLIRNFVFMRADRDGANAAELYDTLWRDFENGFWAEKQRRGRLTRPRLEWFMQSTLQSEIADDIDVGKLYEGYRRFVLDQRPPLPAKQQLEVLARYADKYRQFVSGSGPDPIARFGQQIAVWDASPVHAVALSVAIGGTNADAQKQMFDDILSYIVRRSVCGLSSKSYNKVFLQLLKRLKKGEVTPDGLRAALSALEGDSSRWPRDEEFRRHWMTASILPRLAELPRVRAVFWSLENAMRSSRREELMTPELTNLDIDHILPDEWFEHWPLDNTPVTKQEADAAILAEFDLREQTQREKAINRRQQLKNTIGNLTFLHYGINRGLRNTSFDKKRERLFKESNLHLNRELMLKNTWGDDDIEARGKALFDIACKIWRGPIIS